MTTPVASGPEVGDELGPWRRSAPSPAEILRYASSSDVRERFFTDTRYARSLGFRGLVTPGPMLAAYVEHFLRAALPGWRIQRLGTTFRIPTIAGDELVFHGVVAERHDTAAGERIVCDVLVEHGNGDRAVTATATLQRR
jgi:hydroxyacyl-ACP dehydratase HTD2-like protein with hotdog domain